MNSRIFFQCRPISRNMVFRRWGYVTPFRKALEKGCSEMYGLGGGSRTIFLRNLGAIVGRLGVFGRSAQGSRGLFWRAQQCRLIFWNMVLRRWGYVMLVWKGLEKGFSEMYEWGGGG